MKIRNYIKLTIVFLILSSASMAAQDLKSHQWKNRVVMVFSNGKDKVSLQEQLHTLAEEVDGLQERKIVVYQVTPLTYCIGLNACVPLNSKNLFAKFSSPEIPFKIVLIGLDGKVKLQEESPRSAQELFKLIDSMPMRKRALVDEIELEN